MKLKNKKTGEIIEVESLDVDSPIEGIAGIPSFDRKGSYNSLAELSAEWEDAPEEPKSTIKDVWFNSIIADGHVVEIDFISDEEAEKAVEKLKAWKRLKDKGFRFILDEETEMQVFIYSGANGEKCITNAEESKQCRSDIKLLFGGEE